CATQGGYSGW
nr:immunoglobulin heavy chain junction region [Macaca mulatta]MOV59483.1 immunoglobulin heavy chain junction region [Macaca mulatta]